MAQHTLSDLLTGTQENCASQAFSQLCRPWNCIISLRDSKHGSGSLGRASSLQSVQPESAGTHGRTRPCPHRGAPRGTTPQLRSPAAKVGRMCRYRAGGHERSGEAEGCSAARGCCTKPRSSLPQVLLHLCAAPAQFRSPVEIPQRCQRWGLPGPAKPPRTRAGGGALPWRAAFRPPGGVLCSGEFGGAGDLGERGIWGSGDGAEPAPRRSPRGFPGSPALIPMGPACPAS